MKKAALGVVLAAIALFFWGFIYWGFGPYRTMIWQQAADDGQAGKALLDHFPNNGTYFVPGADHDQATAEGLYEQGPVAFVHMISASGRPMFDTSIMIQGFLLNLVVIVLIAVLLHQVVAALPTYGARVKFSLLSGLIAAVLIDCGDSVWWQIDWPWMLYNAFYHFTAWLLTGLILAKFIGVNQLKQANND